MLPTSSVVPNFEAWKDARHNTKRCRPSRFRQPQQWANLDKHSNWGWALQSTLELCTRLYLLDGRFKLTPIILIDSLTSPVQHFRFHVRNRAPNRAN